METSKSRKRQKDCEQIRNTFKEYGKISQNSKEVNSSLKFSPRIFTSHHFPSGLPKSK